MVIYCTHCKEYKNFIVLKEYIVGPSDDHPPFEYTFAYCEHCESTGIEYIPKTIEIWAPMFRKWLNNLTMKQ